MSLAKQQDGCRNYTERPHKNVNWCEKAETDLITHLVKLPELVPPRKTSRESAHCNEQKWSEHGGGLTGGIHARVDSTAARGRLHPMVRSHGVGYVITFCPATSWIRSAVMRKHLS